MRPASGQAGWPAPTVMRERLSGGRARASVARGRRGELRVKRSTCSDGAQVQAGGLVPDRCCSQAAECDPELEPLGRRMLGPDSGTHSEPARGQLRNCTPQVWAKISSTPVAPSPDEHNAARHSDAPRRLKRDESQPPRVTLKHGASWPRPVWVPVSVMFVARADTSASFIELEFV